MIDVDAQINQRIFFKWFFDSNCLLFNSIYSTYQSNCYHQKFQERKIAKSSETQQLIRTVI